MRSPYATLSKIDFGKGFGRWKTMPTRWRSWTISVAWRVEILTVQQYRACDTRATGQIVHAVERADEGGFAAARRSHERGHLTLRDIHADIVNRVSLAIVDVEVWLTFILIGRAINSAATAMSAAVLLEVRVLLVVSASSVTAMTLLYSPLVVPASKRLSEAPGDVVLSLLVVRMREEMVVAPTSIKLPLEEEGRGLGNAGRLLHVVCHDDDRVALLQVLDEILDLERGDRVERRARLVHQHDLRLDGERAGNAEALLLAAREAGGWSMEPVFDLIPQRGAAQAALDDLIRGCAPLDHAIESRADDDVVVDALRRQGIRLLEHHPDVPAHLRW